MSKTHKKFLQILIFSILLFSINPYKNSIFVNREGNLKNNSRYEPSGLIALWSGPLNTVPEGWKLCDGTDGTLNISDRFVCSTENLEEPGTIGGNSSHYHNYTTVPYHDHGQTSTTQCSHSHPYIIPSDTLIDVRAGSRVVYRTLGAYLTESESANHSHEVNSTGLSVCYTSEEEDVLPPYYELVFIKKETNEPVIPIGLIVMWAGTIETIPKGWVLCNGSNGTPDLREKFVRGVLHGANPGSSGGRLSHNHSYTDIPRHNHTLSVEGYSHNHYYYINPYDGAYDGLFGVAYVLSPPEGQPDITTGFEDTEVPHTHNINEVGTDNCTTQETDHLPPYFKIAFIMNTQEADALPMGSISMWGNSKANIPSCWNQYDTIAYGFPRGIATGEQPGSTGGSATHRHTYTEVPRHTHTVFEDLMQHSHTMIQTFDVFLTDLSTEVRDVFFYNGDITVQYTEAASAPHNHTVNPTGSLSCYTSYESNLPPFIKLVFIQKNLLISNPSPAEGAFGVGKDPTLRVDALKLEGDDLIITFYNAPDNSVIDADVVLGGNGTASVTWSELSYGTSYSWYVIVDDGSKSIQFETWSFTTKNPESFPFPLIITISTLSVMTIIGVTAVLLLKRRRKRA